MSQRDIGVLLIGQTPRDDLVAPLAPLSSRHQLHVRGALDSLAPAQLLSSTLAPIPSAASYPLETRLKDQSLVTVDEAFLVPLLQEAIDDLERDGVLLTVLLCAGVFAELQSERPLLRPFYLTTHVLQSAGFIDIAILVPNDAQLAPARRKWEQAGFQPLLWSLETKPEQQLLPVWLQGQLDEQAPKPSALVVDYVGYPAHLRLALQEHLPLPVFDLGHLTVETLNSILGQFDTGESA